MSLISEIIRDSGAKKATPASRFVALLIVAGFGGSGLFMFISLFLNPYQQAREAEKWVPVEAIVKKSQYIVERAESGKYAEFQFEYSFEYNGESHLNSGFKISEDNIKLSTKTCKKRTVNHPVDSSLSIWVNPENPQQSLVTRELNGDNWMGLLGAIPFLTIALCALLYLLFNGIAFRIQKRAWMEAAQIANRQSAFEIAKCLADENFNEREYADINFLKRNDLITSFAFLALNLFANGILSVFILVGIAQFLKGGNFLWLILTLPLLILAFYFISLFFKHFFKSKGDDYVIVSEWDAAYTWVEHTWLLLSDPLKAGTFGIATTTENKSRTLKKLLRQKPFKNTYTAPDRSATTGSITHHINGSSKKEINLLVYSRSKLSKKYKEHRITIYTPDND